MNSEKNFHAVESLRSDQESNFANSRFIHSAVRAMPSRIEIEGAHFNSSRAKSLLSTLTGTSNDRPGR